MANLPIINILPHYVADIYINYKYMKDYDKNKELSYLQYWDVNNLYGWAMSQKLPVNNFELISNTSQFNKDFIKRLL